MSETVLQFGAGRFLRAFVDRWIHQANESGQNVGKVVLVQTTAGRRAEVLADRPEFPVLVRGYEDGALVDRVDRVASVSRALLAHQDWAKVIEVAKSPALRYIVTNSTEAGYALLPTDKLADSPPESMPAKLTQVLWRRFESGGKPLVLLPVELIERNAEKLLELVATQAKTWGLRADFERWLRTECHWLVNLVDCIITTPPADHPLVKTEPGVIQAEPFSLFAIERKPNMPAIFTNPAIKIVDELAPYYLRKVRILNGIHSAMTAKYLPAGFKWVKEVLADKAANRWVRAVLFEEIVPVLAHRVADCAEFTDATYDRLRNPFIEHKLTDISLNHAAKVAIRLETTRDEYRALFHKDPPRLSEIIGWRP